MSEKSADELRDEMEAKIKKHANLSSEVFVRNAFVDRLLLTFIGTPEVLTEDVEKFNKSGFKVEQEGEMVVDPDDLEYSCVYFTLYLKG